MAGKYDPERIQQDAQPRGKEDHAEDQFGQELDLGMPIVMAVICRAAAHDEPPGNDNVGNKIGQGMGRIGHKGAASSGYADREFQNDQQYIKGCAKGSDPQAFGRTCSRCSYAVFGKGHY
jgi:hypothetical protein